LIVARRRKGIQAHRDEKKKWLSDEATLTGFGGWKRERAVRGRMPEGDCRYGRKPAFRTGVKGCLGEGSGQYGVGAAKKICERGRLQLFFKGTCPR